jgi:hypothetical protein
MHLAGSRPHRNGSSDFGRKRLPDRTCLGARRKEWLACCRQRGTQTIRLIFDKPQSTIRIWLVFEDAENARTQEFLLGWSPDSGRSFEKSFASKWNFSPPNSVRETEDYTVELTGVTMLELIIAPDKSR